MHFWLEDCRLEARAKKLQEGLWQLNFDYMSSKILNADQILQNRFNKKKNKEQFTIEERAKFLHEQIAAQGYRRIRAIQKVNVKDVDKEEEKKDESVHRTVQEEERAKNRS
ncbi:hypothetical protein Tco_1531544 [Tanacetum coccineum]